MSAVPVPKSVQLQLQQQQQQQGYIPNSTTAPAYPLPPPAPGTTTNMAPAYMGMQQQQQQNDMMMMMYNNNQQGYYNYHQGIVGGYNNNSYSNQYHHQGQQQQYSNHHNNHRGGNNNNNNNAKNNNNKDNTNNNKETTNATNCDPATHAEVYAFNNVALYTIPHEDIISMPSLDDPSNSQIKNLQLCPNFDASNPSSCLQGDACKFVHAKLDNAETHNIHVNYAWANPEDVLYECFPPGEMLQVAPPNSTNPTDEIPSHLVLKTRALQSTRRVISHCAHYYFNRVCNRGSECYFIHAVSLTPIINEAGYLEDPTRRIWGRTQTKKNPPTNQSSQRQTPTPTPQVLVNNAPAVAGAMNNNNKAIASSGFQTPSLSNLSRQDSTVGRGAASFFPTQPLPRDLSNSTPPQQQSQSGYPSSLGPMQAAYLSQAGSTQDLTKLGQTTHNSDNSDSDAELSNNNTNTKQQANNNNNNNQQQQQGSKPNSTLSSPFRRTHNPYSMTNPVVRSYNGSPVSPVVVSTA